MLCETPDVLCLTNFLSIGHEQCLFMTNAQAFALHIAPEDFNELMASLVFDSATNRSCVDFTALEDNVVEGTENLTAMLTSDDDVTLLPDKARIEIVDDGGMRS